MSHWLILVYSNPFLKNIFWKWIKGALLCDPPFFSSSNGPKRKKGVAANAHYLWLFLQLNFCWSFHLFFLDLMVFYVQIKSAGKFVNKRVRTRKKTSISYEVAGSRSSWWSRVSLSLSFCCKQSYFIATTTWTWGHPKKLDLLKQIMFLKAA